MYRDTHTDTHTHTHTYTHTQLLATNTHISNSNMLTCSETHALDRRYKGVKD